MNILQQTRIGSILLYYYYSLCYVWSWEREKEFKWIWELETISETNVTFRISNTYTHATSFYLYVAFIGLGLGLVGLLLVVQLICVQSFRLQIVRVFFFFLGSNYILKFIIWSCWDFTSWSLAIFRFYTLKF